MAEPATLDLLTTHVRPRVTIDGAQYELRVEDDFGLFEFAALKRGLFADLKTLLLATPEATDDPAERDAELTRLLLEACKVCIVDPPLEKIAAMRQAELMRTYGFFMHLLAVDRGMTNQETATADAGSDGTLSSRSSPDSTAAIPSAG